MNNKNLLLSTCLLPLLMQAAPAFAQEAVTAPPPPNAGEVAQPSGGLSDIVVTAQRRSERLQDVPVSVTAFSEATIENLKLTDAISTSKFVPGMISQHNAGLASANAYFLRGLGNSQSTATFDAPVTTYVDSVYIARQNANNYAFFDTQRVEVLRGPQGTLFGRNTTGGAINVIMRKPQDTFGVKAEATYGSFDRVTGKVVVDAPLSDQVLTKVAAFIVRDDGYIKNITTGQRLNGEKSWGVRGDVRLLPSENLTIDLSAEHTNNESTYTGLRNIAGTNPYVRTATTQPVFYESANWLPNGDCTSNNVNTLLTTERGNCNLSKSTAVSAIVGLETGIGDIEYIGSYRHLDQGYINNYDATTTTRYGGFFLVDNGKFNQWSHELKLNTEIGDLVDLVTGVFYLKEKARDRQTTFSGGAAVGRFNPTQDTWFDHQVETAAVYAQADIHLTEALTVTLGGRYTWERKDLSYTKSPQYPTLSFDNAAVLSFGIPLTQTVRKFTPRAAISYKVNPDFLLFASATKGFKSGGWNGTPPVPENAVTFRPEQTWSYEGGFKSELFDKRLRFNATGYFARTTDLQITAGVPNRSSVIASLPFNAGTLEVYGLEIESSAQFGNLSLFANPSFMRGKYTYISPLAASLSPTLTPVRVPRFQFSGGATYDQPINAAGDVITGTVTYRHNSPYWVAVLNTTTTTTEDFVDASIGWKKADDSIGVFFEVSNLTQQKTVTANFLSLFPGDPRRFTGRVRVKF